MLPNNSLQLTRLACGKLERDLPAKLRENEWLVARAAGQLSSRPFGSSPSRLCPWQERGDTKHERPLPLLQHCPRSRTEAKEALPQVRQANIRTQGEASERVRRTQRGLAWVPIDPCTNNGTMVPSHA